MRILLLQDQIYLPSLGGGNKACRLLLASLVERGHTCAASTPAVTAGTGPTNVAGFLRDKAERGLAVAEPRPGVYRYEHCGVEVDSLVRASADEIFAAVGERIEEFEPDWILVSDDRLHRLLEAAERHAPGRSVFLCQTIVHLPFGPLAHRRSERQRELIHSARGIVAISAMLRAYLREHAGLVATELALPVYGLGPFANLANFDEGCVTLVNPCIEKGLEIFLGLAERFPDLDFAAVPTWGATAAVLAALEGRPNVRRIAPADDIEEVLARTRVLLAPSLWPETLGYIVVEAMLRGIPVIASDLGGLRQAKLGVDYLVPVRPAERGPAGYVSPPQDLEPWARALRELTTDRAIYERCSRESREAAHRYVEPITAASFEAYLEELGGSTSEP